MRSNIPSASFSARPVYAQEQLAASLLTKLKVYAGSEHPHAVQNPNP